MKTADLKKLRKRIESDRDALLDSAAQLASDPTKDTEVEFATARAADLDNRLRSLPKPVTKVREASIYSERGQHSIFADVVAVNSPVPLGINPNEAQARLAAHTVVDVQHSRDRSILEAIRQSRAVGVTIVGEDGLPFTESEIWARINDSKDITHRALGTGSVTTGAVFSPPVWLENLFVKAIRANSVFAALCKPFPLPEGVSELDVPLVTLSDDMDPQSNPENTPPPGGSIRTTSSQKLPVRWFGGLSLISLQLCERGPGFDKVIIEDMADGFAEELDTQLLLGTGVGTGLTGQILGVTAAAANVVTYTSTSPNFAGLYGSIAEAATVLAHDRRRPAGCILMSPDRWAYSFAGAIPSGVEVPALLAGLGFQNKPYNTSSDPVGPLQGLPVNGH
jgi:HK97 family phage major capsid protein